MSFSHHSSGERRPQKVVSGWSGSGLLRDPPGEGAGRGMRSSEHSVLSQWGRSAPLILLSSVGHGPPFYPCAAQLICLPLVEAELGRLDGKNCKTRGRSSDLASLLSWLKPIVKGQGRRLGGRNWETQQGCLSLGEVKGRPDLGGSQPRVCLNCS